MSFVVGNADLRQALSSVAAHAYPKDNVPGMSTVLFDSREGEVLVTASNGFTVGVAAMSPLSWDGDDTHFAITLKDVPALLKVFPEEDQEIRFEHSVRETELPSTQLVDPEEAPAVRSRGQLTITDVSGLLDGKQLRLRPANIYDRDVSKLWHEIAVRFRDLRSVPRRTPVNSAHLAMFKAAAAAYKEPLIIEMGDTRGNLIIRCGEDFVGLLRATDIDSDIAGRYEKVRNDWKERLPMRLSEVKAGS